MWGLTGSHCWRPWIGIFDPRKNQLLDPLVDTERYFTTFEHTDIRFCVKWWLTSLGRKRGKNGGKMGENEMELIPPTSPQHKKNVKRYSHKNGVQYVRFDLFVPHARTRGTSHSRYLLRATVRPTTPGPLKLGAPIWRVVKWVQEHACLGWVQVGWERHDALCTRMFLVLSPILWHFISLLLSHRKWEFVVAHFINCQGL